MHMTPLDTAAEAHAEHTTQSPPDDQDRREVLVVVTALLSDRDAMVEVVAVALRWDECKDLDCECHLPAEKDARLAVDALCAHLLGDAA